MKKKNYGIILSIFFVILLLTVSYAFFTYNKDGEKQTQIIAGSIYLEANDQGNIEINDMYPMSDEDGIENGVKYQLNIRGHNESERDLYYGVYLNQGDEVEGKIRLKDDEIKVYLTQTVNEETTVVYGPGTLKDFDNKLIHANVINQKTNRDDEVEIDYELTVWIDEKVMISDTITEVEGKRIYTKEEFENAYATVTPTVVGDFKEKNVNLEVKATGTLMTSETSYEINNDYLTTLFTNENVKVRISSEKIVEKFVITNAVTNEVIEKIPETIEGKSVVEIEYTESGSYVYYGVYSDGTTSTIDTYNIKIDKDIPTFVMQDGGTYNVENINSYYKIENTLSNILEDNDYEVMYALVKKGEEVSEYNKIELSEENKIVTNVKSGLWDLVVKVIDEAGKEKIDRKTYTISYTAEIINNNSDVTLDRTTQKLVLGQTFNYLEELPTITDSDFIGYATDAKGNNLITNTTKVGNTIDKIYAIYKEYGLLVKPTSNNCLNVTYNGKSQVLTKDADEGFEYSNNTGINAGSYTITASLKEGYVWSDDSQGDVSITCNITKRDITYKADDAEVTYTGSVLSKNTASVTEGSLAEGHTATVSVSGTITNAGTANNTLSSVIIKDASGVDVTSNYNITMQNGTLTVNKATPIITLTEKTGNNYTGTAISANEATTNSDGEITYTYYVGENCSGTTLSGAPTDAGTYSVKATVSATTNYESATSSCVSHTITHTNYTITLEDGTSSTGGTETLYGRANDGVYLDNAYTKKMTTSANPITVPTKEGYTFGGYYTSENGSGTQLIDANGNITSSFTNSLINSNTTLYAKWTAKPIYVFYNVNGGAVTETTTGGTYTTNASKFVQKNGSLVISGVNYGSQLGSGGLQNYNDADYMNITKTGYTGRSSTPWNSKADGTGVKYSQSTQYTYEQLLSDENIIEFDTYMALYLYVDWVPATYTVTYNGNKFAAVESQTKSGMTINYDSSTSYLTLNGTPTANFGVATLPYTFVEGENYEITLTYVSGSINTTGTVAYAVEIYDENTALLSTRNYKSLYVPTSGTDKATLTVSALGASEGKYLFNGFWISDRPNTTFNNYKVKVNITKVETKTVTYDSTYGTLGATPTRFGYTFAGWYTAESGGTKVETTTKVTTAGNHTLYAHWTPNTYTITLNNQSASTAGTGTLYGKYATGIYLDTAYTKNLTETINPITLPTKTGYTFGGYYTATNGGGTQMISATGYRTSSFNTVSYSSNVTLYAYWTPNNYTVTYNGNKFSTFPSLSYNGITATYDPSTSYLTLNGTPTGNMTLMKLEEALTSGEKYKITLTYISGSYTTSGNLTLATEIHDASNAYLSTRNYKSVTLPKSGSDSSELTISDLSASSGKYFVNTLWVSDRTTTSFSNYVMKVNITKVDTKTVTYNSTYGTLGATPTRYGYTFAGWYTAETGGTQVTSSTKVTTAGNHTLYAHWTEKPIRVYLNTNDGTMGSSTSTHTFTKDSDGYVLVNGGSYYQTVNISGTIDIANYNNSTYINILKTGYTAKSGAEWNTKADGTGTSYNHNTVYNYSNVLTEATDMGTYYRLNLYVNWVPNTYTVTYNGNIFTTSTSQTTNGLTKTYDPETSYLTLNGTPTGNMTLMNLQKTFTSGEKYKITLTYVSGSYTTSGSVTLATEIHDSSNAYLSTRNYKAITLPKSGFASSELEISDLSVSSGKYFVNTLWISDRTTTTFNNYVVKVNVTKVDTKTVTYNSTYGTLGETPSRYGFIFAGWFTAESGGTQIASSTKVTTASNHTLYAHWTNSLISISAPTNSLCVSRTYTGSAQNLTSVTSGTGYTLSGYSQTNAGTYTITASLTSGYKWSDDSTGTKTFTCSMAKATPVISLNASSGTVVAGKTLTFTATVKSGASNGSVSGTLAVSSGTTSVATVSPTSKSISSANNSSGVATTETVTGVASGSSTITVKFTPSDTTNYNSATSKTYTATITKSATIPTNSLCVSRTYNGGSQTLTSATSGTGYTLSGYSQTTAGSHTITATLTSGYRWSDNATGTKTFTCSIAKKAVTYTADSASKMYDGTALTKKTATLTSGSLVSGHTATFSITGTQTSVGSSTNTLNSVTIKSGSTDVTSNYNITKKNGTLTVTPACEWVVKTSDEPTSCTATTQPSNPTEGNTYTTCSDQIGGQFRYSVTSGSCANGTTFSATSSRYVYATEANALNGCTQYKSSTCQGQALSGTCSASRLYYYERTVYEYQCD